MLRKALGKLLTFFLTCLLSCAKLALSNELAHPEPSHCLSRKAPGETEVTLPPRLASVVPGRLGSLRICEGPSACRDSYPRQGNGESHAFTTPSNPTHFNFYPQELICTCLDPRENITALFLRPSLGLIQQGGPSLETVGVGGGGGWARQQDTDLMNGCPESIIYN